MEPRPFFNEMYEADGSVRPSYAGVARWLDATPAELVELKRREAEFLFRRIGITFAVYGAGADPERIIPFDIVPRVIAADEWDLLARGLEQRVRALNAFLHDVYHEREICRAGVIPEAQILQNPCYQPAMQGLHLPHRVYSVIAGIDVVRTGPTEFYVLEDNLRTPSGVSYMLENREMMMRLFPELCARHAPLPIDHYPNALLATLRSLAPAHCNGEPTVAVLTPGLFNSAYFEHAYLADRMGVELVEGQDLFVEDDQVFMRTTEGPKRIDVLYRRIDDDFLDPEAFDPASVLGVKGLMRAYRKGRVGLANAVGTGVADDKATYIHVPKMVEFYLGETPILNNVPTHDCSDSRVLRYVLEHLDELVVKEVQGSGGYGMLIGPAASAAEREAFAAKLKAHPEAYIAQPTLALSASPTFVAGGVAPRHIDLRPFVLSGDTITIVPGGLTRVALPEGSLVVNSSQGGGTKDTWVLPQATVFGG
ncbi:MAG: circularly permuted type 2 ATP-grasp protein [Pseudomonadota bacterium]